MAKTFSTKKISSLRSQIIQSISGQGFYVNGNVSPADNLKQSLIDVHQKSRHEQLLKHRRFLQDNLNYISKYAINGSDIEPNKIDLELIEVESDSLEETIFKWWNLAWWSMPYQRAYGRQMRFVIWDNYHNAPFGIVGLQSPVLKMAVRDKYLEIPSEELDIWVNRSMQAQRVGALPPYNDLIGGKLVALTLSTNEIRKAYKKKYEHKTTLLEKRKIDSNLLFVTTSSAYGRSSIYNRLKLGDKLVAQSLGYTKGFGTFHIPDSIYQQIREYLEVEGIETRTTFGYGPSKRIKLLSQAFARLGLPNYSQHQIFREYFLIAHVENLKEVIQKDSSPKYIDMPFEDLVEYWKQRWCIPRSLRTEHWCDFKSKTIIDQINKL